MSPRLLIRVKVLLSSILRAMCIKRSPERQLKLTGLFVLISQTLLNRLLNSTHCFKCIMIILLGTWKELIRPPRLCTIFLMPFAKILNQKSSIGVIPGRNFWMAVFIALWILQPTKAKLILPHFKVLLSRAKKNTVHLII